MSLSVCRSTLTNLLQQARRNRISFQIFLTVCLLTLAANASVNLFTDTFNRPDSLDIDSGQPAGMSGSLASISYNERGDIDIAANDSLTNIRNNALHLADGTNMTIFYLDHNFIDPEILSEGGIKIGLTIVSNDGNETDLNRYLGFGVGNTQQECQTANFDYQGTGFRGRVNFHPGTSDIWIGWSPVNNGAIQVFKNGPTSNGGQNYDAATGIALSGNDRLELELTFDNFNAGTTVQANILWNGASVVLDTFTWNHTDNNYIGFCSRQNNQGFTVDNLSIEAVAAAVKPAIADFNTSIDIINSSITSRPVTLSWDASFLPSGTTYTISSDKAVIFPDGNNTGNAVNGNTKINAILDGSLGDIQFTLAIKQNTTEIVSAQTAIRAFNPPDPSKPNFIVILTDDQGWGTTSVLIDPQAPDSKSDFFETPNLEKLAQSGIRFTQAYSSHPNCSPSRAALLTGKSPAALHFTDIVGRNTGNLYEGNPIIPPTHINALPVEEWTIPELLKQHNPEYQAAHFGKWHLNGGGPNAHGFDASDGNTGNNEGNGTPPDDPKLVFSITQRANDWMKDQVLDGNPFYLQVSHYATHLGIHYRQETKSYFDNKTPGIRHNDTAYAAMLFDMDEAIGILLDQVRELGLLDSTYIIYTADNGTYPRDDNPGNINGPIRGWKATVWEGGIRVPFMVSGPGIKPGSLSRMPVVGYDILPTICELAGVAPQSLPNGIEGGSFAHIIAGNETPVKRTSDYLVFHWPHYQHEKFSTPDTSILKDDFKLHYRWESRKNQLFNLVDDLGETTDLARLYPALTSQMNDILRQHLTAINAALPSPNPEYKPICWTPSSQYPPNDFMGRDPYPGDINNNCTVDLEDLAILVSNWLRPSPAGDNSSIVNQADLAQFAIDWLNDSWIPVKPDSQ